jgi:ParB family chromosome partitioning protein
MNVIMIKRNKIIPDVDQPRKTFDNEKLELLKENIKLNGIKDPLHVREEDGQYILIDGERRLKSSDGILDELPCIVESPDNVLELQLVTSCLKEDLTVDELDNAIFKLSEYHRNSFTTSCKTKNTGRPIEENGTAFCKFIGDKIGKSSERVKKALDRFQFKQNNQEFAKEIEKKFNPEKKQYSKVNSTISMTEKIKDDEVRKEVVEDILKKRKSKLENVDTPKIKKIIEKVIERTKDIDSIEEKVEITKSLLCDEDDINIVFMEDLNELRKAFIELEGKNYIDFIDSINEKNLNEYKELSTEIFNYFKNIKLLGE